MFQRNPTLGTITIAIPLLNKNIIHSLNKNLLSILSRFTEYLCLNHINNYSVLLDLMDLNKIWKYPILLVIFLFNQVLAVTEKNDIKCDFSLWSKQSLVNVCDQENAANNHLVYCHGPLLEAVNYHKLDIDSKTFVDRQLKKDANEVAEDFNQKFKVNSSDYDVKKIKKEDLDNFIEENFVPIEEDDGALGRCEFADFQEKPRILGEIADEKMRNFAMKFNNLWSQMCRKINKNADVVKKRTSLIYLNHPFIMPGGQSHEYHYSDSLWIIKGLLASGMANTTSRGMLENFFELIDQFGFVPSAGRVYYMMRSQPPLLASMVLEYYNHTGDKEFLARALPKLIKEMEFWETKRSLKVKKNGQIYDMMFQYRAESQVPRPESFCEDVKTAMKLKDPKDAPQLWQDLASADESGWTLSSRWMKNPQKPKLEETMTSKILPVDLNAYICGNYRTIAILYSEIGNMKSFVAFHEKYKSMREKLQSIFFVENDAEKITGWYDYNMETESPNMNFYASMIVPLYMRCYDINDEKLPSRIFDTMENFSALMFNDKKEFLGVPTSTINNKQEFGHYNTLTPLTYMIFDSFHRTYDKNLREKAFQLANKWIHANIFQTFTCQQIHQNLTTDVHDLIYETPTDGLINGAILELIVRYRNRIKYDEQIFDSADPIKCASKKPNIQSCNIRFIDHCENCVTTTQELATIEEDIEEQFTNLNFKQRNQNRKIACSFLKSLSIPVKKDAKGFRFRQPKNEISFVMRIIRKGIKLLNTYRKGIKLPTNVFLHGEDTRPSKCSFLKKGKITPCDGLFVVHYTSRDQNSELLPKGRTDVEIIERDSPPVRFKFDLWLRDNRTITRLVYTIMHELDHALTNLLEYDNFYAKECKHDPHHPSILCGFCRMNSINKHGLVFQDVAKFLHQKTGGFYSSQGRPDKKTDYFAYPFKTPMDLNNSNTLNLKICEDVWNVTAS